MEIMRGDQSTTDCGAHFSDVWAAAQRLRTLFLRTLVLAACKSVNDATCDDETDRPRSHRASAPAAQNQGNGKEESAQAQGGAVPLIS